MSSPRNSLTRFMPHLSAIAKMAMGPVTGETTPTLISRPLSAAAEVVVEAGAAVVVVEAGAAVVVVAAAAVVVVVASPPQAAISPPRPAPTPTVAPAAPASFRKLRRLTELPPVRPSTSLISGFFARSSDILLPLCIVPPHTEHRMPIVCGPTLFPTPTPAAFQPGNPVPRTSYARFPPPFRIPPPTAPFSIAPAIRKVGWAQELLLSAQPTSRCSTVSKP